MLNPKLAALIHAPNANDNKYTRGVVGLVVGSDEFPGAAILAVTAAIRAGIGMARYVGPERIANELLPKRPEVVLGEGPADAWVLGCGVDPIRSSEQAAQITSLAPTAKFIVADAGALSLIDFANLQGRAILTPHAGELERLFARLGAPLSSEEIAADPAGAALAAARLTRQIVLLKGSVTQIASPSGEVRGIGPNSAALATAGTGDVLAGLLGALLAANAPALAEGTADLMDIAELAVIVHSRAAEDAHKRGPVAALDVAEGIRSVMGELGA